MKERKSPFSAPEACSPSARKTPETEQRCGKMC